MRTKLIKIIYHKFELKDEIENKLNFDKKAKKEKKLEIKTKKIKLKKQNTINLDRMMKLKTNKTFTKRQRKEFKKIKRIRTNLQKKKVKLELMYEMKNK
jgi:hypothetical protein